MFSVILVFLLSSLAGGPLMIRLPPSSGPLEIQGTIDRLRDQVGIQPRVQPAIVAENERLVSVKKATSGDFFVLEFDESFLDSLDAEEVEAAIAHELGHVWIFTHHPYLHTEELANRHALKAVRRESLEKVYVKVRQRRGGDPEPIVSRAAEPR